MTTITSLGSVTKTIFYKGFPNTLVQHEFEIDARYGTIVFSADLVAADTFDVTVNGTAIAQVTYATSHANTMALIVAALEAIATVTDASASVRTITIIPEDQDTTIAITNAIVTNGGAGTAVATSAAYDNAIYKGMPVKLHTDGTIRPYVAADGRQKIIGYSMHDGVGGELVTIHTRGIGVIWAKSNGAQDAGPVKFSSFDTSYAVENNIEGKSKYATATAGNDDEGWAFDAATGAGEDIRVALTY